MPFLGACPCLILSKNKNAVASLVWPDTAFCYFLHCSTRFDIGRKFSTRLDADRRFISSVNADFSAVRPAFRHWQEIFCLVRRGSTRTKSFLRYSTHFDTPIQKAIHAPPADVGRAGRDYSLTLIFRSPKPSKRSASALSSAGSSFSSSAFSTACSACFFALACSCFASSAFRFYS